LKWSYYEKSSLGDLGVREIQTKTFHMDKPEMHYGATRIIFQNADILRKNMTASEKYLWTFISKKQLLKKKFRRQHPIGNYIADFYCHDIKLVIEVDGKYHDEKYQKIHDNYRDSEMKRFDIKVIRFKNEDVLNNIGEVLNQIETSIRNFRS
jgi:very-short-patch-repair endonuclease